MKSTKTKIRIFSFLFKKKSIVLAFVLLADVIVFSACKDDKKDIGALGEKAGAEMCACYKIEDNKDKRDKCFDTLETKYGQYENDKSFVSAFEKAFADCMIALVDPEAATAGKQAGIENCECDQLENEDYEECKEIWYSKYEKYFDNTIFLYAWEIEYDKCSK